MSDKSIYLVYFRFNAADNLRRIFLRWLKKKVRIYLPAMEYQDSHMYDKGFGAF